MVADLQFSRVLVVVSRSVVMPAFPATAPPGFTVQVIVVAAAGERAAAPRASSAAAARAAAPARVRTCASPPD